MFSEGVPPLPEKTLSRTVVPYEEVMMHGWMLDSKGRKTSKSLGNVVTPEEVKTGFL